MASAAPVRKALTVAYEDFLQAAFGEARLEEARRAGPDAERYASAQAGGKPWRQSLISNL